MSPVAEAGTFALIYLEFYCVLLGGALLTAAQTLPQRVHDKKTHYHRAITFYR